MIKPLPTPETLIGDTIELHPDDAVSMRELVQLVRADREAIIAMLEREADAQQNPVFQSALWIMVERIREST